jgi:hypothetical protein
MSAVQELVGHRDLSMTQRYSHLSRTALADTIRLSCTGRLRTKRTRTMLLESWLLAIVEFYPDRVVRFLRRAALSGLDGAFQAGTFPVLC